MTPPEEVPKELWITTVQWRSLREENHGSLGIIRTCSEEERRGPLRVITERGVWYVCKSGQWDNRRTYADGLTVTAEGEITGTGKEPDERGDKRAVKKFVAGFMAAFEKGEVPAPGAGDCFYCGMREVGTLRPFGEVSKDAGHIHSHFEESYFVPSLLSRALEVFGASQVCRQWVAAYWDTGAPEELRAEVKTGFYVDHGREQSAKMLRRYLLRQLGYAG